MFDISKIKERISCLDYARSNNIKVFKDGDRTYSPFHNGSNATSFVCYADSWYSFSDGMGGDVIDLCACLKHNGDKGKAISELASLTGIRATHDTYEWRDYMQNLGNRIYHYNTQLLPSDYDYLHSRGISDSTIDAIKIGRNEEGRLVVPYWRNGAVVYFASRSMPGCMHPEAKYKKMKKDKFNDNCVWGLDTLTRLSSTNDSLIIAEGMFDALSCYEQGYPVLSAITGHFSAKQIPEVINNCRQFRKVVLTYDTDPITKAGEKFTIKMAKILYRAGIPFAIAPMPFGCHDLSEYHASGRQIASLLASAIDGIQYLIQSFTDYENLRDFVLEIARSTPMDVLMGYLANSKFDDRQMKELVRIAKAVPNEQRIAEEIMADHELIYIAEDSFYEWNGSYWKRTDDLTIQGYAIHYYGKQFATSQRAKGVTSLLKALISVQSRLNKEEVISFINGTLDLLSGEFREHRKTDYCSFTLDYEYDADAVCPNWEQFIDSVTNHNPRRAEVLQQIAGYVLFPDCKYQKIFVLFGAGSNGKSVYLDMLEKVYGKSNCTYVDPANMSNEFWLIHLKDSLLNFATEINSDFSKAENVLKMLSDGTSMQACYKGQNHITFEPRAKMVFACNDMPHSKTIQGMDRRMHFVDFPVRFVDYPDPADPLQQKRDYDLMQKLIPELPAIFNWCYAGYNSLRHFNEFTETEEQASYLTEFREASNPIEIYVRERTDWLVGDMPCQEVYDNYCEWCERNGHWKSASNSFGRALRVALGTRYGGKHRARIDGLRTYVYRFEAPPFEE